MRISRFWNTILYALNADNHKYEKRSETDELTVLKN